MVDPFEQTTVKSVKRQTCSYNPIQVNIGGMGMIHSYKAASANVVSPAPADIDGYSNDTSDEFSDFTGSVSCSTQTSSSTANFSSADEVTEAGISSKTSYLDADRSTAPKIEGNLSKSLSNKVKLTNARHPSPVPSPQYSYTPGLTPQQTLEALAEMQTARDGENIIVTPQDYISSDGPRRVLFQDKTQEEKEIVEGQKQVKISVVSRKNLPATQSDFSRNNELLKSLTPIFSYLEKFIDGGCNAAPLKCNAEPFEIETHGLVREFNLNERLDKEFDDDIDALAEEEGVEVHLISYEPTKKEKSTKKKKSKNRHKKHGNKKERRKITPMKINLSVVLEESLSSEENEETLSLLLQTESSSTNAPELDISWNLDTSKRSDKGGDSWVGSLIRTPPPKETKGNLALLYFYYK